MMARFVGGVAAALIALTAAACGSDAASDDAVVGSTLEQRVLEIGGEDVDVTLGANTAHPTRLLVPATAVPQRMPVTVRLSTVTKAGANVPTGTAVQIATRNVAFSPATPARMQQAVDPPPPGKTYAPVTAQDATDAWAEVPRRMARRVPTTAPALVGDARAPLVAPPGQQVWEIDVLGTGLWALALVDDPNATDAGVPDVGDGGVADGPVAQDGGTVDATARPSLDPAPTRNVPGVYQTPGGPVIPQPQSFELALGSATSQTFVGTVTGAAGDGTFYLVKTADADGGAPPGDAELAFAIATSNDGYRFTAPVFCGVQLAKLVWSNAVGTSVLVLRVTTTGCVEPDVRATIAWDDKGRDWELHLVKPGGTINDNATDCTWTSCINAHPDWGVPGDPTDDPAKDVDNTGGYGPENIFLARPEPGRFTVLVEHWGGGEPSAGQAILNVRGVVTVVPITSFVTQHVRTIATIDWPSGAVTVVGSDFDCSGNWSGGCRAKLP
jgi:hypothetical protein